MEDIYVQAIQEIEDTGKLLLMTRQLLCAKQKERNKLALFSMEKYYQNGLIPFIQKIKWQKSLHI